MISFNKIDQFSYEFDWASNFYPVTVIMDGVAYASVEHAYQAAKTTDIQKRWIFTLEVNPRLHAAQAKKMGRKLDLRPDWDAGAKDSIMRDLVMQKFTIADVLKKKLLATEDALLEEGNWWHDTYWGVCHGKMDGRTCKHIGEHLSADDSGEIDPTVIAHIGSNKLGLLLMDIRQTLKGLNAPVPLSYNLVSGSSTQENS